METAEILCANTTTVVANSNNNSLMTSTGHLVNDQKDKIKLLKLSRAVGKQLNDSEIQGNIKRMYLNLRRFTETRRSTTVLCKRVLCYYIYKCEKIM